MAPPRKTPCKKVLEEGDIKLRFSEEFGALPRHHSSGIITRTSHIEVD
jgi:hypothetical protein